MSKKTKIYMSLPVTGRDRDEVERTAKEMKNQILRHGFEAVNTLEFVKEGTPYHCAMGQCIEQLLSCDYILLAWNWQESKGCKMEYFCAQIMRIKQIHFSHI